MVKLGLNSGIWVGSAIVWLKMGPYLQAKSQGGTIVLFKMGPYLQAKSQGGTIVLFKMGPYLQAKSQGDSQHNVFRSVSQQANAALMYFAAHNAGKMLTPFLVRQARIFM
jgi:hypothetical protein